MNRTASRLLRIVVLHVLCIVAGYVFGQLALVDSMFRQFEAEGCQINHETGMVVFPAPVRAITIETIFNGRANPK